MPQVLELIGKMTNAEKLRVMDMLWTSILSTSGMAEPPAWHGIVLSERRRLAQSGEEKSIPWETAKQQLREEFACR